MGHKKAVDSKEKQNIIKLLSGMSTTLCYRNCKNVEDITDQ